MYSDNVQANSGNVKMSSKNVQMNSGNFQTTADDVPMTFDKVQVNSDNVQVSPYLVRRRSAGSPGNVQTMDGNYLNTNQMIWLSFCFLEAYM